jgi:hypothetical protein
LAAAPAAAAAAPAALLQADWSALPPAAAQAVTGDARDDSLAAGQPLADDDWGLVNDPLAPQPELPASLSAAPPPPPPDLLSSFELFDSRSSALTPATDARARELSSLSALALAGPQPQPRAHQPPRSVHAAMLDAVAPPLQPVASAQPPPRPLPAAPPHAPQWPQPQQQRAAQLGSCAGGAGPWQRAAGGMMATQPQPSSQVWPSHGAPFRPQQPLMKGSGLEVRPGGHVQQQAAATFSSFAPRGPGAPQAPHYY